MLTVGVSQHSIATGDETLHTSGINDCSAVVFMTNRDPLSHIYRDRTMLHVNGSDMGSSSADARSGSPSTARVAFMDAVNRRKGSDHRLVVGFGLANDSPFSQQMFRDQLSECMDECRFNLGSNNMQLQPPHHSLTVTADGSVVM
ncbi:hypothetical protein [Paraburkholderia humisilvae]|uniref:hypothetical protein n=1 Tax=Paraburkholderia humisilvae TaxID=627669 RepID=UPI001583FD7D|nr:hypothetical protein [Paraburkholderia humisilvae]